MKNHNIILITGILMLFLNQQTLSGQVKTIEREWTSFQQSLEINTNKVLKFKLSADIKPIGTAENSAAALWINSKDKNGNTNISESKISDDTSRNTWKTYTIEGSIDPSDKKINFGGTVLNNGIFYFDNFQLYIENDSEHLEKIGLLNPSFETMVGDTSFLGWDFESDEEGSFINVKGFSYMQSTESTDGEHAMQIEGEGIERDASNFIYPVEGYSPQIGTLVAMLNNLSERVEKAVKGMDKRELDFLLDERANSIGALVLHLAAAEAYYQVYTFENREFNDEEKIKWQAALELDEKGRQQIKEHDVNHYLELYKEVRKITLSELKKRNDEWLARTPKGGIMNNHFSWFHVMEHQSSHLGQIRLLKKRIPEEEHLKLNPQFID